MWIERKSGGYVLTAIVVFICLTYLAAWAWMKYVDRACAEVTQWLEKRAFQEEDEAAERQGEAEKGFGDRRSPNHDMMHGEPSRSGNGSPAQIVLR